MAKPRRFCLLAGCDYPVGECSGACLTPRDAALETDLARYGIPVPLPIDVARPDPEPGDPWPYHLCMPSVDWPDPVGAVLRPDPPPRARSCPPCSGDCRQGRDCPAYAPEASSGARLPFALFWLAGVLVALALFIALRL